MTNKHPFEENQQKRKKNALMLTVGVHIFVISGAILYFSLGSKSSSAAHSVSSVTSNPPVQEKTVITRDAKTDVAASNGKFTLKGQFEKGKEALEKP